MNLILAVPDLNDTQLVEAVRAQVGPDVIILAANDPRICGLRSIGDVEPLPPKELTEEFLIDTGYNPVKPIPSRRGRRFADYKYHEKNFNRLRRC